MRKQPSPIVELNRLLHGPYASELGSGINGAYVLRDPFMLAIIASIGGGWEHVSVSHPTRTPTWSEMQWVKEQFWQDDEVVFQLHPAKRNWVNNHPYCLHLWRHKSIICPTPPEIYVGYKHLTPEQAKELARKERESGGIQGVRR
jgi:hypothetical protein